MSKRRPWDDLSDYEKSQRWWRSLDAGARAVFIQALWETQGEPLPGHVYDSALYDVDAPAAGQGEEA